MAQTQLRLNNAQIFVTLETSQDTYETQSAGEAILAENVTVSYDSSNYQPNYVRGDGLSYDEIPAPMSGSISFRVPCKGSGTAGTVPEFDLAMLACGWRRSDNGTTDVTYYPVLKFASATDAGPPSLLDPGPSYSITALEDGVAYRLYGAFGNFTFTGSIGDGGPGFLDFTFQGAYQAVGADGLESVTYDTTQPQTFAGASMSINIASGGAYTPKGITTFSFDSGNVITMGQDVNETNGYYGSRIIRRRTTGSINPEMVLPATQDYFGAQRAGSAFTLTTGAIGATAGNIYTININRAVFQPISMEDRGGIRALNCPFSVSSAADDVEGTNTDIEIVFT